MCPKLLFPSLQSLYWLYWFINMYFYHVLFCSMLHNVIVLHYIDINSNNLGSRKLIPLLLWWSSSSLCEKSFSQKLNALQLLITSILKTSVALCYLACFNTPSSGMKRCSQSLSFRTNLLTQISPALCSSQSSLLQSFILQCELVQSYISSRRLLHCHRLKWLLFYKWNK